MAPKVILFRCNCGYALVTDEGGDTVRFNFSEWRINRRTGRVTATCRRCPTTHTIREASESPPAPAFAAFLQVEIGV